MEKIVMPNDKEYMKMAMLKHEQTFREQVYELHRLYQIQKQLMKNVASTRSIGYNQNRVNSKKGANLNQIIVNAHDHQKLQRNLDPVEKLDDNGVFEIEDESEIKLTLGPSSFNRRMRRKTETPLNSDSGASFSSSSGSNNRYIRITDKEREGQKYGISDTSARRNIASGEEEELRQDRLQQSPWLFKVLSLNMT